MQIYLIKNLVVTALERVLVLILIVSAAYVLLGRIAMSGVHLFDARLSSAIAQATKADVTLSRIYGDWMYFDPIIKIEGLAIGEQPSTGVLIGQATFRVNTIASIIERNIVFDEIEIDDVNLSLTQDSEGKWQVDGLPPADKPVDLDFLLNLISHINYLSAGGLKITVNGAREQFILRTRGSERFTLIADKETKHFSMPLEVESSNRERSINKLALVGRFAGDLSKPETIVTQLYFKVPSIEYLDFLPDLNMDLMQLTQSNVEGEFWLNLNKDEVELIGNLVDGSIQMSTEVKSVSLLQDLHTEFIVRGSSLDHLQLFVNAFDAEVGGKQWSFAGASVTLSGSHAYREMGLHLPGLDVGDFFAAMLAIGRESGLLTEATQTLINSLKPSGELSDIQATMNLAAGLSSSKLTAKLKDIRIDAHQGIPGISSLSGFVKITPTNGYLDVHNEGPFSLNFSAMFPEAWSFDTAHARINYDYLQHQSENMSGKQSLSPMLQISSDLIRVKDGVLSATGRVHLNLPPQRENQTWGLELGLHEGDLKDVGRYLPKVLPLQVQEWINRAFVAGDADEGGMVFHGSLYRGEPRDRKVHELYFKTSNTEFDYDPNWPRVEEMNATVFIGYDSIHSDGVVGRVRDVQLTSANFKVPVYPDGSTDSILINGKFAGNVPSAIYLLNNTPIAEVTKNMAETWQGEGGLTGQLSLDFPIGNRSGEVVNVGVEVELVDSKLAMPLLNLEISELSGILEYETVTGLRSPAFNGKVFSQPVQGVINTQALGGKGEIDIELQGAVSTADLYEWSKQVLLTQMDGLLGYDLKVHIPVGQESSPIWIEATSDLAGVTVDLPAPMGKLASGLLPAGYTHTFHTAGDRVDIRVGEDVIAALKIVDGELSGGRVHFGKDPLGVVTFDKLAVSGSLERADYSDWEKLIEAIQSKSLVSIESELANQLRAIEVNIADLNAFGIELENVRTYITRKEAAWSVGLRNEMLSGIIEVSDVDTRPLSIVLDYLHLPIDELIEGQAEIDPLAGQDPADIAALDFQTDELMIGDEHYGMWSFNYRPTAAGGRLENLSASVKGLQVLNDSIVLWSVDEMGQQKSTYTGHVLVPELDQALEQWGYASSIEGENFEFEADVFWLGSPAMVDLLKADGSVRLQGRKGRFVQADNGAGALKVLGIFDFASLARRFRFDFSDILDKGFSFNEVSGDTRIREGEIKIVEPIVIKGSSGSFRVGGQISLVTQELDSDMIVTLPLSQNLPWYAAYYAIAAGPLVGAGVWVAQKVFEKQIDQISSAKYKVSGTVEEPVIEFVSIFNDSVRDMSEPGSSQEQAIDKPLGPVEKQLEVLEGM
jgi:uncharacterized protein (TIGR02099 family)